MKTKFLILTFLYFNFSLLFAQTHNFDTVIDSKFYSYVEYYNNGRIKTLGNYNDTLKTGDWIYYNRKGDKLAYGLYKDNHKFGLWIYIDKKNEYRIKWTDKNKPSEMFEYDKKGNLVIIDIVYSSPCFHYYRNGFAFMTGRTM